MYVALMTLEVRIDLIVLCFGVLIVWFGLRSLALTFIVVSPVSGLLFVMPQLYTVNGTMEAQNIPFLVFCGK
jgi:hypothetical protein